MAKPMLVTSGVCIDSGASFLPCTIVVLRWRDPSWLQWTYGTADDSDPLRRRPTFAKDAPLSGQSAAGAVSGQSAT
eukprot:5346948-Pyramimonas_sp.AAC.1